MNIFWTKEEEQWLCAIYADTPNSEIARRCGRTISAVKQKGRMLGLRKKRNSGKFRKGNTPWSKGKKVQMQNHWTRFTKGHIPPNANPPGEWIRYDCGKPYWISKEPGMRRGKWKHQLIWEREYGPAPAGHVITFKDKNTLNCTLENLECISRAELAIRNKKNATPRRKKGRRNNRRWVDQVLRCEV